MMMITATVVVVLTVLEMKPVVGCGRRSCKKKKNPVNYVVCTRTRTRL